MTDPQRLVIGLVGMRSASNEDFVGWFKNQVLKVIRERIAELMVKKKWPLLDVTSGAYTEQIEAEVLSGVKAHVPPLSVQIPPFWGSETHNAPSRHRGPSPKVSPSLYRLMSALSLPAGRTSNDWPIQALSL